MTQCDPNPMKQAYTIGCYHPNPTCEADTHCYGIDILIDTSGWQDNTTAYAVHDALVDGISKLTTSYRLMLISDLYAKKSNMRPATTIMQQLEETALEVGKKHNNSVTGKTTLDLIHTSNNLRLI